ncbi:MAG: restriction endonuclease, partial [Fimbriimonadaceae bacterium]
MLKHVIDGYLANISSERGFYVPFLALLQAMGYRDVHLVHGTQEKGKDFIAKSYDLSEQWVFQVKRGDIGTPEWRSDVHPQLLECATTGLSHPSFDRDLPRKIVLATTGVLNQEANDRAAEMPATLSKLGVTMFEVWSRPKLLELFLDHGLESLRGTDTADLEAYGQFLRILPKTDTSGRLSGHQWPRKRTAVASYPDGSG